MLIKHIEAKCDNRCLNAYSVINKFPRISADGVEYVVDAGKRVYNKVASSKEDLTETPAGGARSLDSDAEWLP